MISTVWHRSLNRMRPTSLVWGILESLLLMFWSYVDWKGNFAKKKELTTPSMKEFEVFFEDLYQCQNQTELYDILSLETDVHVPILDDPINETEVNVAFKDMKKSGFD